ncbi:hypothetical protein PUN28_009343 [Cardiocondyla obscurior]|uniref:Uncharacterized protein n=1 Tax=Cardiocondyla obscurior TaxID=286306 RepID=A0AAW2FRJ4_9HYME
MRDAGDLSRYLFADYKGSTDPLIKKIPSLPIPRSIVLRYQPLTATICMHADYMSRHPYPLLYKKFHTSLKV